MAKNGYLHLATSGYFFMATDIFRLPPTLIVVGTHDCLLDDSRNVSARMRAAGVDVTLVEIAGGFHGFILLPAPESKEARRQIFQLRRHSPQRSMSN